MEWSEVVKCANLYRDGCTEKLFGRTCKYDHTNPAYSTENIRARVFTTNEWASLLHNKYPYDLAPGITHMVLWFTDHVPSDERVRKMLDSVIEDEMVWWENPDCLKTIPGVSHVHVIVKGPVERGYQWFQ